MADVVTWTILGASTTAYLFFLAYLATSHGGIRSWGRDRESLRLAGGAAGAFGLIVAMYWMLVLLPKPA